MRGGSTARTRTQGARTVALDSRRRVCLGAVADELAKALGEQLHDLSFEVSLNEDLQIVLTPLVSVPAREAWLWKNPAARKSVLRGIEQAKRGELLDLGSFAGYVEEEAGNA